MREIKSFPEAPTQLYPLRSLARRRTRAGESDAHINQVERRGDYRGPPGEQNGARRECKAARYLTYFSIRLFVYRLTIPTLTPSPATPALSAPGFYFPAACRSASS
ncbi:hypothetical protein E2C01_045964 [Portunus trituberculatus]|uniref:Uncharacterized protein n=1 Tax=Portunus trituberculatus TaxID=210409 RepID=A0A5B7G4C3_PORTR|nr:hypothetical protein [Portunus trituberculatus]